MTFRRDDEHVQKYHIEGEDEADPKAGSISFVTPVARLLMGKAVTPLMSGMAALHQRGRLVQIASVFCPTKAVTGLSLIHI